MRMSKGCRFNLHDIPKDDTQLSFQIKALPCIIKSRGNVDAFIVVGILFVQTNPKEYLCGL
jgi:hypothetical protein